MTTLRLIEPDENAPKPLTGDEVLRPVVELIESHFHLVPVSDPHYGVLSALRSLGPR